MSLVAATQRVIPNAVPGRFSAVFLTLAAALTFLHLLHLPHLPPAIVGRRAPRPP